MQDSIRKILEEREMNHGDFYYNFTIIGKMWGALLGVGEIQPYQVALMMDTFKTVRAFRNPAHEDNWNDKVGYTHHAQSCAFYDVGKRQ